MTSPVHSPLRQIVGRNIKAARTERGQTQSTLAAAIGVEVLAVSRWERGVTQPSDANLVALSESLGRTPAWFFTDHEREPV